MAAGAAVAGGLADAEKEETMIKFWTAYGVWLKFIPLIVFTLLFCNGCWDKKELNQLALAQVAAIDYEDDSYQVTLQLIIPGADKETVTSDNLWAMSGSGSSVGEAMQQIALAAPREIYLDHLNLVLLGEGVLQHDVGQALEYLLKENVLRRRTRLLAAAGSAGTLLSDSAELSKMDIFYMDNLLKDQRRRVHGNDAIINAYYLSAYSGLSDALVIPHIILEQKKELRLEGAALVQDGKLIHWADKTWLSGYYWVMGGSEIMTLPSNADSPELQETPIVVELQKKPCKWEVVPESPLAVKATMKATIKIVSGYDTWKTGAEAETVCKQIQAQVEAKALQQITDTFYRAQLQRTDIFRLGRWLYAWHPDLIQSDRWPEQFSTLPITFTMDTSIAVY